MYSNKSKKEREKNTTTKTKKSKLLFKISNHLGTTETYFSPS